MHCMDSLGDDSNSEIKWSMGLPPFFAAVPLVFCCTTSCNGIWCLSPNACDAGEKATDQWRREQARYFKYKKGQNFSHTVDGSEIRHPPVNMVNISLFIGFIYIQPVVFSPDFWTNGCHLWFSLLGWKPSLEGLNWWFGFLGYPFIGPLLLETNGFHKPWS